ncbi:EamA family transporter, partial [Brevundimonas sp.]
MLDQKLTPLEIGAIVAIVIIWGVNNAAAKLATEYMPPMMVAAMRFGVAAVCLVPFVRPPFPNWKALMLIAVLGGPIHYGLIYYAFSLAHDVSPVSVATQMWIPF